MKWLMHRMLVAVLHQPALLRGLGAVLRRWPVLAGASAILASHASVDAAFRRPQSFSNRSHAPNLPAGEFLIGLESGPRHACERAFLQQVLPDPEALARASDACARTRIARIQADGALHFDLIDDYLRPVAWTTLDLTLGPAAGRMLLSGDGKGHQCMDALAHLGAHLIGGQFEPASRRARSLRAATFIQQQLAGHADAIAQHWQASLASSESTPASTSLLPEPTVVRHAAGLMLVGHPGTVQAGALVMHELLNDRRTYASLCDEARRLGEQVWADAFRTTLREVVLQRLSRRPPFPMLTRDLPRDTGIDIAPDYPKTWTAGSAVFLLLAAAMADPQARQNPPSGSTSPGSPATDMVFGVGPRDCIARLHATEVLVSALTGLLSLGPLRYHDSLLRRIRYDGLVVTRLRLALPTRGA